MMELLDWFLHLDEVLPQVTSQYQGWTYAILFAIIFCETGLVVTPILPGDSLLFAVGRTVPRSRMASSNIWTAMPGADRRRRCWATRSTITSASIWGRKVLSGKVSRWLNRKHLEQTQRFFEQVRRQDDHPGPLRADRPHVRAVRRRRRHA